MQNTNKPYFGGPMQKMFLRHPIVTSMLVAQNEVLHTALVLYREYLPLSLYYILFVHQGWVYVDTKKFEPKNMEVVTMRPTMYLEM